MSKSAQWAIKQHIEKYPVCEWLCVHSAQHNLGEEKPEECQCNAKEIRSYCPIHGEKHE